jgi:hypothetical protein
MKVASRSSIGYLTALVVSYITASSYVNLLMCNIIHRGADESLVRPGRKQATATEDCDVHISYL